MTNGAIWIAPFGKDFAGEMGFFYSFNVAAVFASPFAEALSMIESAVARPPILSSSCTSNGLPDSVMSETPNVEVTGAARLHRAASSDRRERGRPPGWAA
jgi:hypothetical protein